MRVLIVSYWFPPENTIGAVRVGKLAEFLERRGHDVRVLAAPPTGTDSTLPLGLPEDHVRYVEGWRIDDLLGRLSHPIPIKPHTGGAAAAAAAEPVPAGRFRIQLRRHFYALRIPDSKVGWVGCAITAAREWLGQWRPEIVVASSPPVSNLLVGRRLARAFGMPWIADLRDPWTENPYNDYPAWRRWLDQLMERGVLRSAAHLTTVTPLWGEILRKKHSAPVSVVLNGYSEEDFAGLVPARLGDRDTLSILYAGTIYPGRRDPSALFAALALLGDERRHVRVDFFGSSPQDLRALASRHGVAEQVHVHGRVPLRRSLELQVGADILLLMQWDNPADAGNIPAKYFEYAAAGRPILFIGYEAGTLARMIEERQAGCVCSDPRRIAEQLRSWLAQRRGAGIPALPPSAKAGLDRRTQFEKLERILLETARARPAGD
jgi:glycosyltransferase involved in cell wall biosynthesis